MTHHYSVAAKIYRFYRSECCWPYALSFLLALLIYILDFYYADTVWMSSSILSYVILFSYYLYNVRLFKRNALHKEEEM